MFFSSSDSWHISLLYVASENGDDFSLLIYGGFSKQKALLFNFASALTALIGAILTFYFYPMIPGLVMFLLPIAAGNFIYLACVDMVPELHKERGAKRSAVQLAALVLGIVLIAGVAAALEH